MYVCVGVKETTKCSQKLGGKVYPGYTGEIRNRCVCAFFWGRDSVEMVYEHFNLEKNINTRKKLEHIDDEREFGSIGGGQPLV